MPASTHKFILVRNLEADRGPQIDRLDWKRTVVPPGGGVRDKKSGSVESGTREATTDQQPVLTSGRLSSAMLGQTVAGDDRYDPVHILFPSRGGQKGQ